MSQIENILTTVKRLLKANGITYAQVAVVLDLSEASVKRLFSDHSVSLERLEKVAQLLGMEIIDVMHEAEKDRRLVSILEFEQEQQLVSDKRLLLVAHLVVNGWRFQDILRSYAFTEPELISCLIKLQKIGLLELLPSNKIKLAISPQFHWQRGGPVQQFFLKNFLHDFFDPAFVDDNSTLCAMSGFLSPQSQRQLAEKIAELEIFFTERIRHDAKQAVDQRTHCGCVLAIRPWQSKLYDGSRKN